jgi:hypothetical protein
MGQGISLFQTILNRKHEVPPFCHKTMEDKRNDKTQKKLVPYVQTKLMISLPSQVSIQGT